MDESRKRKTMVGIIIAILFMAMKTFFLGVNDKFFLLLLYPVKLMLELHTNTNGVLVDGGGYYFSELNILVDRSCSGINFFIISFLLILYYVQMHLSKNGLRLLAVPIVLVSAYFFTLVVNTSRIFISVFVNQTSLREIYWMHEVEGAFIYLSFFIILFRLIKLLENKIIKQYA